MRVFEPDSGCYAYPIADFLELYQDVGFTMAHYERVNLPDGGRDKGRIGVVLKRP